MSWPVFFGRRGLLEQAIVLAIGILALPKAVHAYRPFDGTDADVLETGEFELELGPTHLYREGGADFLIAPAVVLNFGVAQRLELVADFKNFVSLHEPEAGHRVRVRDTDVLAKILLRRGALQGGQGGQGSRGPSVAIEAGVLLPETGESSGLGAQADTIVSFAGDTVAVHLNESIADNRAHCLEFFSGAIVEVGRTMPIRPVAEAFVDHVVHGASEYSGLVGAVWRYRDGVAVDLGGRAARADGIAIWEVRLGFTLGAPLWRVGGKRMVSGE